MEKIKFSDLYTISSGISSTKEQAGHGSPFLSFSTVFNNFFIPDKLEDLMDTSESEQKTYSIKSGDIFLTRTSEVIDELAMSSVALKDYPNATYSGFLKRLRPIDGLKTYPKFMAFYLRTPLFRKTITNNATMTLRASFNETIFSYLDLLLPDYSEQKKIGDFLYLINQKIALNKQINARLEEMAKTLYDYWFVQFDFPDANGKPHKSSGGEMVFDKTLKREIPKGWEVKNLGDWAEIRKGTLITEKTANTNGDIKVISAGVDFSYYHDVANRPKNTITISASGANAGFVNFWREPIFACDCTTITNSVIGRTLYILNFLKIVQDFIYQQARGSAQPHVYPKDIEGLKIIVPPDLLLKRFSEFVENWNLKIANNEKQNHQLTQLRDFLLPMLMNGQVSVAE